MIKENEAAIQAAVRRDSRRPPKSTSSETGLLLGDRISKEQLKTGWATGRGHGSPHWRQPGTKDSYTEAIWAWL